MHIILSVLKGIAIYYRVQDIEYIFRGKLGDQMCTTVLTNVLVAFSFSLA